MVHRTRAHELEGLAKARLTELFVKEGWTVEELTEDYGEDFFVRIFDQGTATPFGFFVQSKATDSIARYRSVDSTYLSYPVTTKHLEHWNRFWEPVVLVLFDASTGSVYWRIVQNWMEQQSEQRKNRLKEQATASVRVPVKNALDKGGIAKLRDMTVMRFRRFENEQEGANHLIECIREIVGLDISYNAQEGILIIPRGAFVPSPDGGASSVFFGKTLVMLEEMAEGMGLTYQEIVSTSITELHQKTRSMRRADIKRLAQEWDDDDA